MKFQELKEKLGVIRTQEESKTKRGSWHWGLVQQSVRAWVMSKSEQLF
jgi:hypothetical protein